MKKIYISADVEGLNGVTSFKQTLPEYVDDYAQMRPQLHLELNALLDGLNKAGVDEIVVNDAHNTMTNITLSLLPMNVRLISGKPKKVSMMYGLDESFDGVILFAYHAKAASDGVLAHTFNINFKCVWLNGERISEAQLNGIYAKTLNVPIVLASGDDVFCKELKQDLGNIKTIQTKTVVSKTAAICEVNENLLKEYKKAGENINSFEKIFAKISDTYCLKVEFDDNSMAEFIAKQTDLKQDSNCVCFNSTDFVEIYTMLQKISAVTTLRKNQNQQV